MKRILFFLLIISQVAKAQTDDSTRYVNYRFQYGTKIARIMADSVFHLPVLDTMFTPNRPGALTVRPQDSLIYQFNGIKWGLFSSATSAITSLNGLTDGVQYLDIDTTAADASWLSVGTTHTLRLPARLFMSNIQNQNASAQTGNFWISGTGQANNGFKISNSGSVAWAGGSNNYSGTGIFYQNTDILDIRSQNQILIRPFGGLGLKLTNNSVLLQNALEFSFLPSYSTGGWSKVAIYNDATHFLEFIPKDSLISSTGGSLPSLSQYHVYVGDGSSAPVDAGSGITYDGNNLLINGPSTSYKRKLTIKDQTLSQARFYGWTPTGGITGGDLTGNGTISNGSIALGDHIDYQGVVGYLAVGDTKLIIGNTYNSPSSSIDFMLNMYSASSTVTALKLLGSGVINIPNAPSTYSSGGRKMLVRNETSGNIEQEDVPIIQTLSSQYTDVSNSGTSETDLMSYTLPASKLANDGDRIEVDAYFTTAANANNKTLIFYFGGFTQTWSPSTIATGAKIHVHATIIRTSATTQTITWDFGTGFSRLPDVASATATLSSTVNIKFTGTSATASSDITQKTMTVTYYPAP